MEAALSAMPWGEVKSVLSDLETLLEAGEETATLRTIKALRADLETLLVGRETDARRLIGELTSRLASAEAAASAALPSMDDLRSRLASLEARKAALGDELAKLRAARSLSTGQLQALTQHMAALKTASATLTADHSAQVPRVKHSLSLYANISSIRWDYDAAGDDVAGYIAPPGGAPVRPFFIEGAAGFSATALADRLWEAVGQAYGTGAA